MDNFAHAQIDALKRRVADLEQQLRVVYEHVGLDASVLRRDEPEMDPELAEMLRDGHMVQAIKRYHETHDVDLMTAKVAIERLYAQGNF